MKVRKIGNSLGVIFPKRMVEEENLIEGQDIEIQVFRKIDVSDAFGCLREELKGISLQELADMDREDDKDDIFY